MKITLPPKLMLIGLALAAGCARAPAPAVPEPGAAGTRRAALARLVVENRTDQPLVIAFRAAVPPAADVVVGSAAPGTITEMAPVPAGEPIILLARTSAGAELRLPPRSLEIDGDWSWVIPADARFDAAPVQGSTP